MNRYYTYGFLGLSLAAIGTLVPQQAQATPIKLDEFNYAVGNLDSNATGGNWTAQNTTGTQVQVVEGNLTYPGRPDSTGKMVQWGGANNQPNARSDYAAVTSGSIFASFLYRADNLAGLTTAPKALVGLRNSVTSQSNANIMMRLASGETAKYNLGILERGASIVWDTTNYSIGDTQLLIFSWDHSTASETDDTARLWVNPASDTFGADLAPTYTKLSTGGTDGTAVNRFRIRQDSTVGRPTLQSMDNLILGTTWADVTPIPEPAAITLISLAGLAGLVIRRFF